MQFPHLTLGRFRPIASVATAVAVALAVTGSPAAAAPAQGEILNAGGATAIPNSYIVVLKDSSAARTAVDRTAVNLTRRYGGAIGHRYTSALRGFSVRLSAAAAARLATDPAVELVEQNHVVRLHDTQPNPPSWGLDRVDQRTLPLDNSYTYPAAGGAGVHAYVIDSGFRFTHRDIAGRAISGVDLVDGGRADDCHGHGTHVGGTLGGTTFGVAKRVTLVAVRNFDCDGTGDVAVTTAAVDWVTANAIKPAVANLSLGYPPDYDGGGILDRAVARSISTGITYAVSAGNNNDDACDLSPARVPTAITVAGSQYDDGTWPSSNEGPCVDLFAPALYVVSAGIGSDTEDYQRSGTSMAAPHVAGAAAILLGVKPTLTPDQVRDELVRQATPNVLRWVEEGTPNLLLHIGPTFTDAAPN